MTEQTSPTMKTRFSDSKGEPELQVLTGGSWVREKSQQEWNLGPRTLFPSPSQQIFSSDLLFMF